MRKMIVAFLLLQGIYGKVHAQSYTISVESAVHWYSSDFYLNYKAVDNPDLLAIYGDESRSNEVEEYEFSPQWSVIPTFSYVVKNPRKKRTELAYHGGIGYSALNFIISDPKLVRHIPDGMPLTSGEARKFKYNFSYLSIPLGVSRQFQSAGKKVYASVGVEIVNHILLSKTVSQKLQSEDDFSVYYSDERLVAARDYWVSLGLNPRVGVALGRNRNMLLALEGSIGLTPMNLLKKEERLFMENGIYNSRDIKAFEESRSLNFFYGVGLSLAYRGR